MTLLTKFLSNRSSHVMVNAVSGVPKGSVLGHIIVPPVYLGAFSIL